MHLNISASKSSCAATERTWTVKSWVKSEVDNLLLIVSKWPLHSRSLLAETFLWPRPQVNLQTFHPNKSCFSFGYIMSITAPWGHGRDCCYRFLFLIHIWHPSVSAMEETVHFEYLVAAAIFFTTKWATKKIVNSLLSSRWLLTITTLCLHGTTSTPSVMVTAQRPRHPLDPRSLTAPVQ